MKCSRLNLSHERLAGIVDVERLLFLSVLAHCGACEQRLCVRCGARHACTVIDRKLFRQFGL
jgi:hypothetical protein